MQITELRRDLAELADEIEPFGLDLLAVHRRVRRRHLWLATATAAAVVIAVAALIALVNNDGPKVHVESPKRLVQPNEMRGVDLIVTPADASAEQTLERTDGVVRYATVAQGSMATDPSPYTPPNVHDAGCAVLRAPGYAVETESPEASRHVRAALHGAHVYDVTPPDNGRVEVFMKLDAAQREIDAVRTAIAKAPGAGYRFLSHEDAYDEFKRLFANQPALLEQTDPSQLPVSFRIFADRNQPTHALIDDVKARVENMPGVDIVQTRDGTQWLQLLPGQSADPANC